jgi:hypothetical protein
MESVAWTSFWVEERQHGFLLPKVPFLMGNPQDRVWREGNVVSVVNWLERDRWSQPSWAGAAAMAPKPLSARFERAAGELILVVSIRPEEAEHGALISVPAPGQSVRLRVPPGTTSGRLFRLPRSNAPAPDGFGDLLVRVEVSAG